MVRSRSVVVNAEKNHHGEITEKLLRVRLTRRKWEDKKRLLRNRLDKHKNNVLRYSALAQLNSPYYLAPIYSLELG